MNFQDDLSLIYVFQNGEKFNIIDIFVSSTGDYEKKKLEMLQKNPRKLH